MTTRTVVVTHQEAAAVDRMRIEALRAAARAGLDDLSAGRFKTFKGPDAVGTYLDAIAKRRAQAGSAE